jgi:hypothetical protein
MPIPFLRRFRSAGKAAGRPGAVAGNLVHIPAPPPEGRGGQPATKSPGLKETYTAARKSPAPDHNFKMSSNSHKLNPDNFDAHN